jgi:hypothetical protein
MDQPFQPSQLSRAMISAGVEIFESPLTTLAS